jgi:hypothetical protein
MMANMIRIVLAALLAAPTLALAEPNPERWDPLSRPEHNALLDVLRKSPPGAVTVACPKRTCAALATSVEKAFADGGWKVTRFRKRGIGVDGVVGLRVAGCGHGTAGKIADAMGKITDQEVETEIEPACRGDGDVIVVIGDKPE